MPITLGSVEDRTVRWPDSSLPAPAGEILPRLTLAKRRLKQLELIQLVREQREARKQELAFSARPFVLCGLPLRPLPNHQLRYRRRNGNFFLQIVAHPNFGLPFGQDRLIPIWVAPLALRQKNRTVHFDSAAQMLDFFCLAEDGRYYRRMVRGFQRIFGSTIFFGTEDQPGGSRLINWRVFTSLMRFISGSPKTTNPLRFPSATTQTPSRSAKLSTQRSTSTAFQWSERL